MRTTGVGISIYFDSSKLKFNSLQALHKDGLIGLSGTPDLILADSNNDDLDESTDSRAVIAYLDVDGTWPALSESFPLELFTMSFDAVSSTRVEKSQINLGLETAPGFDPLAPSITSDSCLDCFSLDADGDGLISPVSDGLLIGRFLSGHSGPELTSGAVGDGAIRVTPDSIISYLEDNRSQLDVDGDGEQDFATDGVLIARFLFGLEGQNLSRDLLSDRSTRTDPSDIAAYIESRLYVGAPSLVDFDDQVSVAENQLDVATVSALDPNGDEITFTLRGSDAAELAIDQEGRITFLESPDFEQKSQYSVQVLVSDEDFVTSRDLQINIIDVDEPPTIYSSKALLTISENESDVAKVQATDPEGRALSFAVSGEDSKSIEVDPDGELTLIEPANFEKVTVYYFDISVSDGSLESSREFTLLVEDLDEPPVAIFPTEAIRIPNGESLVTTITASDPESREVIFSLSGADAGLFSIASSGVLSFNGDAGLNETTEYGVVIEVSDGSNTVSGDLSIVVEVDEDPLSFIDLQTHFVFEKKRKF